MENIIIDGFNFTEMESMKYWSHPKSYDPKKKKEESKYMCVSGNYMGARKYDGAWNMLIKDMEGNFHLRSRTESVNGCYTDKAEWIPWITEELSWIPNGTVLIGEICFPNNEGSRKITSVLNCLKDKCIDRQKKNGILNFYVFDILAYKGKSLIDTSFETRIRTYLEYELADISNNNDQFSTNIKELKKTYKLNKLITEIYDDTSKYGETFIYCVPYDKAIQTLMDRKQNSPNIHVASNFSEGKILIENAIDGTSKSINTEIYKLSEAEKLCFRQAMQELNVKPLKNNNDEKVVIQLKEKKVLTMHKEVRYLQK